MICELTFEINGPTEEQEAVARQIARFMRKLEIVGDIANTSGVFGEVDLVDYQAPRATP